MPSGIFRTFAYTTGQISSPVSQLARYSGVRSTSGGVGITPLPPAHMTGRICRHLVSQYASQCLQVVAVQVIVIWQPKTPA